MILAPLFPVVVVVLAPIVATSGWPFQSHEVFILFSWGIPASYLGALFFGWPVYILLVKFKALNLLSFLASGVISGAIAFLFMSWLFSILLGSSISAVEEVLAWGAGLGMLCAFSFATIAGITK